MPTGCCADLPAFLTSPNACRTGPLGSYSALAGAAQCTMCKMNTFNPTRGSSSEAACTVRCSSSLRVSLSVCLFLVSLTLSCSLSLSFQACPDVTITLDVGATQRSSCVCPTQYYMDNGTCTVCTEGMTCDDLGQALETLPLAPGYWRTSRSSRVMVPCDYAELCVGGRMNVTGTSMDLCLPNQVR